MSEKTNIGWTSYTASPWLCCTEQDQCCDNCYARVLTEQKYAWFKEASDGHPEKLGPIRKAYKLAGYKDWKEMPVWGNEAPRVKTVGFEDTAIRLNRKAAELAERPRMFTSMMDWLDKMPAGAVDQYGHRLTRLELVADFVHVAWMCKNLNWLLLTKRPQNTVDTLCEVLELYSKASCNDAFCAWLEAWLDGAAPKNFWLGYSAGTKATWIKRHDESWNIPAAVTWCSAEPLLEALDFADILRDEECPSSHNLDWLVIGGESGKNRRDIGVEPIVQLATHAKQCGCWVFTKQDCHLLPGQQGRIPDAIWQMKEYPQLEGYQKPLARVSQMGLQLGR